MAPQRREIVSFGPFSLVASERLLTKEGAPVELGARALDILIALVSTPNEVVSKRDLLSRVWPDVTVEESSLRFQVAGLRKALGDGKDGARYITTLAGRGYCFVAPVSRSSDRARSCGAAVAPVFRTPTCPAASPEWSVAKTTFSRYRNQLTASRFVTIVGAGGVGKTTVAVAVAHDLVDAFAGVCPLRRSRNAERSQTGDDGRGLDAGAVGSVGRRDARA